MENERVKESTIRNTIGENGDVLDIHPGLLSVCDVREDFNQRLTSDTIDTSTENFGGTIRGHWSAENQLHGMLAVAFREDNAKARKDNSPLNLNALRKIALSALKRTTVSRLSIRKKKTKAARDQTFLSTLIFQ